MRVLQRVFKGRSQQQLKPLAQIIAGLFKSGAQGAWYDPSDINLNWRYNLLTYTEQFDNAAWVKRGAVSVTPNSTTAPDGTNTADLISGIGADATNDIYQGPITVPSGVTYTNSFYIKKVSTSGVLALKGFSSVLLIDLSTLSTDWNKISLPGTMSTTTLYWQLYSSSGGSLSFYIWGASCVQTAQAPTAYQRVNTSTDYDTVGFKPYLLADGVDDGMVTNSIDFTATDKMTVCAGVRKLSDASVGTVLETSTTSSTTAGTFGLFAPRSGSSYGAHLRGTLSCEAATTVGNVAPSTNVVTFTGNIAATLGSEIGMRVNGTAMALTYFSPDAGTGNLGNQPLYLFRRGGTTLPFSGRFSGMILVGKTVTDGELSSIEKYMNNKTGAY